MVKKVLIVCFGLFFSSLAIAGGGKKYFICDILKEEPAGKTDPTSLPSSFDGDFSHWDRPFFYKEGTKDQTEDQTGNQTGTAAATNYEAFFSSHGQGFALKRKGDILSQAFLTRATEQAGFYREIFDIYRFNMKTRVLTHSYLYYLDPKDFEKNFNNSSFVPYNLPFLFDLLDRPLPSEDYVKLGWDKSQWRCYRISALKHLYFQFKAILKLFMIG